MSSETQRRPVAVTLPSLSLLPSTPPPHSHTLTTAHTSHILSLTDTLTSLPSTPHRITLDQGPTLSHTSITSPALLTPHHWHTLTRSPLSLTSPNIEIIAAIIYLIHTIYKQHIYNKISKGVWETEVKCVYIILLLLFLS